MTDPFQDDHPTLQVKLQFDGLPQGGRRSLLWNESNAGDYTAYLTDTGVQRIEHRTEDSLHYFLTSETTLTLKNTPVTWDGCGFWDQTTLPENLGNLIDTLVRVSVRARDENGWSAWQPLFTGVVEDLETTSDSGKAEMQTIGLATYLIDESAKEVRNGASLYRQIPINRAVRYLLSQKDRWAQQWGADLSVIVVAYDSGSLTLEMQDGSLFYADQAFLKPEGIHSGYVIHLFGAPVGGNKYIVLSNTLASPSGAGYLRTVCQVTGNPLADGVQGGQLGLLTGFCWPYTNTELDQMDIESVNRIPTANGLPALSVYGRPPEDGTIPAPVEAIAHDGTYLYLGIEETIYRYDAETDTYTALHSEAAGFKYGRAYYSSFWASRIILWIGWDGSDHNDEYNSEFTAYIIRQDLGTGVFTTVETIPHFAPGDRHIRRGVPYDITGHAYRGVGPDSIDRDVEEIAAQCPFAQRVIAVDHEPIDGTGEVTNALAYTFNKVEGNGLGNVANNYSHAGDWRYADVAAWAYFGISTWSEEYFPEKLALAHHMGGKIQTQFLDGMIDNMVTYNGIYYWTYDATTGIYTLHNWSPSGGEAFSADLPNKFEYPVCFWFDLGVSEQGVVPIDIPPITDGAYDIVGFGGAEAGGEEDPRDSYHTLVNEARITYHMSDDGTYHDLNGDPISMARVDTTIARSGSQSIYTHIAQDVTYPNIYGVHAFVQLCAPGGGGENRGPSLLYDYLYYNPFYFTFHIYAAALPNHQVRFATWANFYNTDTVWLMLLDDVVSVWDQDGLVATWPDPLPADGQWHRIDCRIYVPPTSNGLKTATFWLDRGLMYDGPVKLAYGIAGDWTTWATLGIENAPEPTYATLYFDDWCFSQGALAPDPLGVRAAPLSANGTYNDATHSPLGDYRDVDELSYFDFTDYADMNTGQQSYEVGSPDAFGMGAIAALKTTAMARHNPMGSKLKMLMRSNAVDSWTGEVGAVPWNPSPATYDFEIVEALDFGRSDIPWTAANAAAVEVGFGIGTGGTSFEVAQVALHVLHGLSTDLADIEHMVLHHDGQYVTIVNGMRWYRYSLATDTIVNSVDYRSALIPDWGGDFDVDETGTIYTTKANGAESLLIMLDPVSLAEETPPAVVSVPVGSKIRVSRDPDRPWIAVYKGADLWLYDRTTFDWAAGPYHVSAPAGLLWTSVAVESTGLNVWAMASDPEGSDTDVLIYCLATETDHTVDETSADITTDLTHAEVITIEVVSGNRRLIVGTRYGTDTLAFYDATVGSSLSLVLEGTLTGEVMPENPASAWRRGVVAGVLTYAYGTNEIHRIDVVARSITSTVTVDPLAALFRGASIFEDGTGSVITGCDGESSGYIYERVFLGGTNGDLYVLTHEYPNTASSVPTMKTHLYSLTLPSTTLANVWQTPANTAPYNAVSWVDACAGGGMNGIGCFAIGAEPDKEGYDYHRKFFLVKNVQDPNFWAGFLDTTNQLFMSRSLFGHFYQQRRDGTAWFVHYGYNTLWYAMEGQVGRASKYAIVPGDKTMASQMCFTPATDYYSVYGVSAGDYLRSQAVEEGQDYLWQFSRHLTPRIDLLDVGEENRLECLRKIAEIANYIAYYDASGIFSFKKRPSMDVTDYEIGEGARDLKKRLLKRELYNSVSAVPSVPQYEPPKITYRAVKVNDDGEPIDGQVYNGAIEVRQTGQDTIRLILTCVVGNYATETSDTGNILTTWWTVFSPSKSPQWAYDGLAQAYPGNFWNPGGYGIWIKLENSNPGFSVGDQIVIDCPGMHMEQKDELAVTVTAPELADSLHAQTKDLTNPFLTPERVWHTAKHFLNAYGTLARQIVYRGRLEPVFLPLKTIALTAAKMNVLDLRGFLRDVSHSLTGSEIMTELTIREWQAVSDPAPQLLGPPDPAQREPTEMEEAGLPPAAAPPQPEPPMSGQPITGGGEDGTEG